MTNVNNFPASGYVFNHTMLRVKDLTLSIAFYEDILGFTPISQRRF